MSGVRGFVACLSTILLVVSVLWIPLADVETDGIAETREAEEEALLNTSSKLETDPLVQRTAPQFTECVGALREEGGRFVLDGDGISVVLGIGWVAYWLQGTQGHVVRVEFVDARDVEPGGKGPLGHTTYRITSTQDGPRTDRVSSYEEVVYEGLYDGIDLRFHLVEGRLKYDYVVMPEADHSQIRQVYLGVEGLSVDTNSASLMIDTPVGTLSEEAPFAYQDLDGGLSTVDCQFEVLPGNELVFSLGHYDTGRTLVIDPEVEWSTFIGGNQTDGCNGIRLGKDGYIYLSGWTYSPNLPVTPGAFDDTYKFHDAWFAKMDPNGTSLEWCTYVSGSRNDYIDGFQVDDYGCIYAAGHTYSKDFPTTEGAFNRNFTLKRTGIAFKLSSDGSKMLYSTTFGWGDYMDVSTICTDDVGRMYIVGAQPGYYFPVTKGSVGEGSMGGMYLIVLNPAGSEIEYTTRLGGSNFQYPTEAFVDEWGSIYIAGRSSDTFPTTSGAVGYGRTPSLYNPYGSYQGDRVFVLKINSSGMDYDYSAVLGGPGFDGCSDLFVDEQGCAWIAGSTASELFPTTIDAYNMGHHGGTDAFITKLDPKGRTIQFSTLLGGEADDRAISIYPEDAGIIHVLGVSNSPDLHPTEGVNVSVESGRFFIANLNLYGSRLGHLSFIPANCTGGLRDSLMSELGEVYMAGWTRDPNLTITPGAFQVEMGGGYDAYVTKFAPVIDSPLDDIPPEVAAGPVQVGDVFTNFTFDGSGSYDNVGISEHVWTFEYQGTTVRLSGPRPTFAFEEPGIFKVTLYVTDVAGNRATATVRAIVNDVEPPVAEAGPPIHGEPQLPVKLWGGRSTDDFGIVDYEWTIVIDGVPINLRGIVVEHTFNASGEFWVTLTVYDVSGNWDEDTVNITLTDYRHPVANAGKDQRVFSNTTAYLDGTASADNVAITNFTWTVVLYDGNTSYLYGPKPNITLSTPGKYQVQLEVSDATGRTDTDVVVIEVMEQAAPDEPEPSEDIDIPITNLQIFFLVLVIIIFIVVILLNAHGGGGEIRV